MRISLLFRIALLAAAVAAPAAAFAKEEPACPANTLASLALTFDSTGRPYVPVSVEGKSEEFLIDTGGMFGMLSWHTVNVLGLQRDLVPRHLFYMMNGTSMKYYSTVHAMKLGDIELPERPFLVMPPDWTDTEVAGTIAPDTLGHYDVDLDFGTGRVNLIAPTECEGNAVTRASGPHVTLPLRVDRGGTLHLSANLDGQEMDAVIDTGSGPTVLRLDEADAVLGRPLELSERVSVGTGASIGWNAYRHPFKLLTIGGIKVNDPDVLIMTDKLGQVHESEEVTKGFRIVGMQAPPLIIGMNVLRQLHLYIAYKRNVLYATTASAR